MSLILYNQYASVFIKKIIKLSNKIKVVMYRGTPYLNRNIKRRQQQRSMQYHVNNLTHMRPRTGTIQRDSQVQINNKKKQMQKQARFTQIQRQNRILLEKISSIMGKQHHSRTQTQNRLNRSLNSQFRKRQLQNIQIQNAKLLRRLQQKKPNYQTQKFKQSWRKQKQVIKNLSNYPFIINDKRRKRISVSQIGGRDSKANVIQLCRMRVIDGVSFLITLRLTHNKLQIIGDTKDNKQLKVIQIERKQAIQFIDLQCSGKIQNVFNSLRYDKVDEILYLVANNIQIEDVKRQNDIDSKVKKNFDNDEFNIEKKVAIQKQQQILGNNIIQNKKQWVQIDRRNTQKFNKQGSTQFKKNSFQKYAQNFEQKNNNFVQNKFNSPQRKIQASNQANDNKDQYLEKDGYQDQHQQNEDKIISSERHIEKYQIQNQQQQQHKRVTQNQYFQQFQEQNKDNQILHSKGESLQRLENNREQASPLKKQFILESNQKIDEINKSDRNMQQIQQGN